ncbi:MAG: translation initiation factor IF-2 associated domain-containing protein, partial [Gammaproteobacteria bacterium]
MAEVTVKQLADVVGTPVERLLEQIKDAGLAADNADARISDEDKMQLLSYLRNQHGKRKASISTAEKPAGKITLKRRSVSELKVGGSTSGRGKTVAIEVRKKRNLARQEPSAEQKAQAAETPEALEQLEKLRADQQQRELEREREQQKRRERMEQMEIERKQEEERKEAALAKKQAEKEVLKQKQGKPVAKE